MKFWEEYLAIDQTIYLEQMYARLLNCVDNPCWQHYNGLILLQWLLMGHISTIFIFSYFTLSASMLFHNSSLKSLQ